MTNWIRKYWILLVAFVVLAILPFAISAIIQFETPEWWTDMNLSIIGTPKDWLMFWGTYISSLITVFMAYIAYCSLRQVQKAREGILVVRLRCYNEIYVIEFSNIGINTLVLTNMTINDDYISTLDKAAPLGETSVYKNRQEMLSSFSKSQTYLNPNESKIIFLAECKVVSDDALKSARIKITTTYRTLNKKNVLENDFCINELYTGFMLKIGDNEIKL